MKLTLNNKVYDVLKWVAMVFLPAVAILLKALQAAWGWNIPIEAILATFAAIETFIGSLIAISTFSYNQSQEEADNE